MRPHIAAIYAFARTADDFADEPGLDERERLRLLDDWQRRRLTRPPCGLGRGDAGHAMDDDLIFLALAHTIASEQLPVVALRGSAERVPAGRDDDAVRDVGRRARLLPAIGESGRPSRAARGRLRRPAPGRGVGRASARRSS